MSVRTNNVLASEMVNVLRVLQSEVDSSITDMVDAKTANRVLGYDKFVP